MALQKSAAFLQNALGSGECPQGLLGELYGTQRRAVYRNASFPPRDDTSGYLADEGGSSHRCGDAGDTQGAGAIVDGRCAYAAGEELYAGEAEQVQGRLGEFAEAFL